MLQVENKFIRTDVYIFLQKNVLVCCVETFCWDLRIFPELILNKHEFYLTCPTAVALAKLNTNLPSGPGELLRRLKFDI